MVFGVAGEEVLMLEKEAASMDLTAAAMSQWANRIKERSIAVNDFAASFTELIVDSNNSGGGAGASPETSSKRDSM